MANGARSGLLVALRERAWQVVKNFGLSVRGVEVTQGIQYQRAAAHLTDPKDRGRDNSLFLVADKPAWVRVYVRGGAQALAGVTGTVTVQKRRYGVWQDSPTTLAQQWPPTVIAQVSPAYDDERRRRSATLNFVIPAVLMRGNLRLRVEVRGPGGPWQRDEAFVEVDATLLQTLRIRGIPIRYWGPDAAGDQVRLDAPSLSDFQTTASWTLKAWPVSQTPDVSLAGVFTWSQPLTDDADAGACSTNWNNLLFWLGIARTVDGNRPEVFYVGLLPPGTPIGPVAGCGGPGNVATLVAAPGTTTMAHEMGHVLDWRHAPCGNVGPRVDPDYPAYEPYDTTANRMASIGEYGFDVTDGTIFRPNTARDFMGYCRPRWISLYHHQALYQHSYLAPRFLPDPRDALPPYFEEEYSGPIPHHIPDPPPPWVGLPVHEPVVQRRVPAVVVSGVMRHDEVEVRSVLRLDVRVAGDGAVLAGTVVELLDHGGQVLAREPLRRVGAQASCGCGGHDGDGSPTGVVQAMLPDVEGVTAMRVIRDGEEIWAREAPSEPPTVAEVGVRVDEEEVGLAWRSLTPSEEEVVRFVRWSADEGESWQALAVGLDADEAIVPIGLLPPGEVLIQVLVSDGFFTTAAEPVSARIPDRAPVPVILAPTEAGACRAGERVRLWGVATASDGRTLPGDALRWELDGHPVGTGTEVWAELPEWETEHRVALIATEGERRAETSVVFLATASGRRPYRFGR